tara:strand:+ start:40 stop:234 length:195 start_codon:yes stop_codon:yes gene_type:complete
MDEDIKRILEKTVETLNHRILELKKMIMQILLIAIQQIDEKEYIKAKDTLYAMIVAIETGEDLT